MENRKNLDDVQAVDVSGNLQVNSILNNELKEIAKGIISEVNSEKSYNASIILVFPQPFSPAKMMVSTAWLFGSDKSSTKSPNNSSLINWIDIIFILFSFELLRSNYIDIYQNFRE